MTRCVSKWAGAGSALAAALLLASCGQKEEKSYEVGATDEGGGELIVSEAGPDAVPVDLPETEMTNAPAPEGDEAPEGTADE